MIENEGVRAEYAPRCLICGSEGALLYGGLRDRLGAPGIWSLLQCSKCQLVWLNPRPILEDIGKLYCQYFTHNVPATQTGLRKRAKASILQNSFGYQIDGASMILGSLLNRIGPLVDIVGGSVLYLKAANKGRLLDVGCGNGRFINQMRQLGWEVVGVELDGMAVSIARERLGLTVYHGSLEEAKLPNSYFDVITINHVIEHVVDPIALLNECGRVMRPGGKLIVITPNINSQGRCIFGRSWVHLDPPRHLFVFSTEALRMCAEEAGLKIQDLRTTARLAGWSWAVSSDIRQRERVHSEWLKVPSSWLRLVGLGFQAVQHRLCKHKTCGEELVLVATYRIQGAK